MTNLSEDIYRHFYKRQLITAKDMANLILGNDPRVKPLAYRHLGYKSILEKITYKFKCKPTEEILVKELFHWAVQNLPDFKQQLPLNLILNTVTLECTLPQLQSEAFSVAIPCSKSELESEYVKAMTEIYELKKTINNLNSEIERLSVFEKKIINKQRAGKIGGENSINSKKEY